jgi:hypothetical protein
LTEDKTRFWTTLSYALTKLNITLSLEKLVKNSAYTLIIYSN